MSYVLPSTMARAAVRRRIEGAMSYRILISRGTLGQLDETTGLVGGITDANTVYRGPARIREVTGSGVVDLGGGEIAQRSAIISIPISSPNIPVRDDLVQVIDDGDADRTLDTRVFRVLEVDGGGLFGDARRMTCSGWFQSRWWKP